MKEYAFGIDLGGTTAKIGLFTTAGALLEKWEVPTDTSNAGEHILENLAAAIMGKMQEKAIPAEQVEGVGIGVPGPVDASELNLVTDNWPHGTASTNANVQFVGQLDKESDDAIISGNTDLAGATTTDGQPAGQ